MTKPFVKNASSKKQVKEAAKKERFKEHGEKEDMSKVLSLPEGRRVLWRVLSQCGVFRSSVEHSGSMTYFNEGRRDIGLFLVNEINLADMMAFPKMMQENSKEQTDE